MLHRSNMADNEQRLESGSSEASPERKEHQPVVIVENGEAVEDDGLHHLHRGLKARQITMIAM